MNVRKCDLSFEMSSEEMLGIAMQPADTCDFNYPMFRDLDYCYNDLRTAVADAPYAVTSFRALSFDEDNANLLQSAIDGFEEWKKGWFCAFKENVKPHLSEEAINQFNQAIDNIEDVINSQNRKYANFDAITLYQEVTELVDDIEKSTEQANEFYNEHNDEVESLRSNISQLQESLQETDNESEIEDIEALIEEHESELSDLEDKTPWQGLVDDANRAIDKYHDIYTTLGESMQDHYTHLRQAISEFKTITKYELERLQQDKKIDTVLPYPEQALMDMMESHSQKSSVIVSATPEVFIRRIRKLERNIKELGEDERDTLMNDTDLDQALEIAIKRFKQEYPDYERLLCYENSEEAKKGGKRRFISLEQIALERRNDLKSDNIELSM
tara:strand:+ start:3099 stop:4256 length:1158 start_codon:yes stop_codon:yes gene_type:complete